MKSNTYNEETCGDGKDNIIGLATIALDLSNGKLALFMREADENTVILAIKMKEVRAFKNHGATQYKLDLINKVLIV